MRFQSRHRHVIDLLFPVALFFVFAVSSLSVLLLAADAYAAETSRAGVNDESRTALSYISEKIRQNDANGAMAIVSIDGTDCLALSAVYNGTPCTTYIYVYDGSLKELFINDGIPVPLKEGRDIIPVSSLSMERLEERVYLFTAVDSAGTENSVIASERSVP